MTIHLSTIPLLALALASCGNSADVGARVREVDPSAVQATAQLQDTLARQADSLVRAGRPWRASALLAPRLRDAAAAPAELRLVGARAAAAWEGWTEVDRLLRGALWLDSQFDGEGRELLARSELERGQDATADARLALDAAHDDATRVARRVFLARAYDRANASDSASASYAAAAGRLPRIADWLRLRAAGVTSDSGARAALFAKLASPVARERIANTDAQARERSGDLEGASRAFTKLGLAGSAFRVLSLAARDDAAKAALAQRITGYLGGSPGAAEVRQSIEVLDKLNVTLAPAQELTVARAAAEQGLSARALSSFTRAGVATLTPADRRLYAGALLRAGRAADAARQYAMLSTDPALAPVASYDYARALLQSGDGAGARAALRQVATRFVGVQAAAAPALLLLADLQIDDGDVSGGAATLAEIGARYPNAPQAPIAGFRRGLAEWPNARSAAADFDTLVARHPGSEEAIAARYWAGRAWERAGQRAEAEKRWREVIAKSPMSYYAGLSADRLKIAGWTPPPGADTVAHTAVVDSAVARVRLLDRLGMDVESRFELDALAERAKKTPAEAPVIAQALIALGQPSRALRVATGALDSAPASRTLLRAAYPLVHSDALVAEAKRNDLDPALVAGLIRQESSFNPAAVSPAGARGLMQLMPSVGAAIARARGYPLWNPTLLFEPEVSLELGSAHLASSLRKGEPPARALAAYNAGATRVARWSQRPGAEDPELFAEWIPFTETRDYVRIVQRNADVYRALYGLK